MFLKRSGITNQMRSGTMYEQKDVVLIPFPYSDLTGSKQRPALVISNQRLNNTQDRICCLVTSKQPYDGLLISDKSFAKGKLPFKSWVKPHRIFTINERIIKKKLCSVNDNFHNMVIAKLNDYLEFQ